MAAAVISAAALMFVGAPLARADTNVNVREILRELQIDPPMLYPSRLPRRLRHADTSLDTDGGIAVAWDRGAVSRHDNNRVGYVGLYRGPRRQLAEDKRIARSRGYRPRKVHLRRRTAWRLSAHVCGYSWIEHGRAYGVYGIYYVGDENGRTVARDQRRIIRSLRLLR